MERKSKHGRCSVNESMRVKEIEREMIPMAELKEDGGEKESDKELAFGLKQLESIQKQKDM